MITENFSFKWSQVYRKELEPSEENPWGEHLFLSIVQNHRSVAYLCFFFSGQRVCLCKPLLLSYLDGFQVIQFHYSALSMTRLLVFHSWVCIKATTEDSRVKRKWWTGIHILAVIQWQLKLRANRGLQEKEISERILTWSFTESDILKDICLRFSRDVLDCLRSFHLFLHPLSLFAYLLSTNEEWVSVNCVGFCSLLQRISPADSLVLPNNFFIESWLFPRWK